ncbi:MAG: hypothetical protein HY716_03505 [Planctomycetes bacterium]|nr:hypothetical protein [Planctomycetota bacterium]
MPHLLSRLSGSINQELLRSNEYLLAENKVLRRQRLGGLLNFYHRRAG